MRSSAVRILYDGKRVLYLQPGSAASVLLIMHEAEPGLCEVEEPGDECARWKCQALTNVLGHRVRGVYSLNLCR
jgi:hypothetical protein